MISEGLRKNERALRLSSHATLRARQRGIKQGQIEMLMSTGDIEQPVGRGCTALTISRNRLAELRSDGMCPSTLDALERLSLVLGPDGGVITVMKLDRGRRGRRYRRGRR